MKTYQIRSTYENLPEERGFLIAEFTNWTVAKNYLHEVLKRYPDAFISIVY